MEQAARWTINNIMQLVKKQIPNIHLYIIGKNSDKVLANIKEPNITITGRVDNVLPYLCHSDVALVPLKFESGACGIPIVSTTLGAEGINVIDGKSILIADEPQDFANRIFNDQNMAKLLSKNCKALIQKKHSVEYLKMEAGKILNYVESYD